MPSTSMSSAVPLVSPRRRSMQLSVVRGCPISKLAVASRSSTCVQGNLLCEASRIRCITMMCKFCALQ